jgi:RNA polymerase sigma-70 factor, ECF subfamily
MKGMSALTFPATVAPLDGPDDRAQTLTAARSGDLAAFERLIRQYERLVMMTAMRMLGNLEDAQDVSQEVFLRFYRNLGRVESNAAITSWLYRVTINACHDLRRRRPAAAPLEDAAFSLSAEGDPQQSAMELERRKALELALRHLSGKERAALVLRDIEGLATGDVARVLGSSQATVRSQIAKGRIKMRGFLERYFRRRS